MPNDPPAQLGHRNLASGCLSRLAQSGALKRAAWLLTDRLRTACRRCARPAFEGARDLELKSPSPLEKPGSLGARPLSVEARRPEKPR
jgi:hypothetical protein